MQACLAEAAPGSGRKFNLSSARISTDIFSVSLSSLLAPRFSRIDFHDPTFILPAGAARLRSISIKLITKYQLRRSSAAFNYCSVENTNERRRTWVAKISTGSQITVENDISQATTKRRATRKLSQPLENNPSNVRDVIGETRHRI